MLFQLDSCHSQIVKQEKQYDVHIRNFTTVQLDQEFTGIVYLVLNTNSFGSRSYEYYATAWVWILVVN